MTGFFAAKFIVVLKFSFPKCINLFFTCLLIPGRLWLPILAAATTVQLALLACVAFRGDQCFPIRRWLLHVVYANNASVKKKPRWIRLALAINHQFDNFILGTFSIRSSCSMTKIYVEWFRRSGEQLLRRATNVISYSRIKRARGLIDWFVKQPYDCPERDTRFNQLNVHISLEG